jgi:electron transfer flavoprotein alpha subunit
MSTTGNVMVFIEVNGGRIADVSRELVCEASKLAAELGVEVEGIALGHGIEEELRSLAQYGCRRIYYAEDERLAIFTSVPYGKTISHLIRKHDPQVVLYGATTTGRDVGPRVASELGCGLTADCTALEIGACTIKDQTYDQTLLQIRPAFGGNIIATIVSPTSRPSMATVREGVMKIRAVDNPPSCEIVREENILDDSDYLTEVLEVVVKERSVDLKGAKIIVTAGMGAGDPEGIAACRELARTLGGQLGASRAVVDAKLLGKDHQVGQTGITVRPNLYIACGVSGQIQHLAGMDDSQRIIAINSDPGAPIFNVAHYEIGRAHV